MIGRGGAIDLHAYYHADAQGNVTTLIHSSGTELANYTYDSFGNLLAASGTWATLNPYRFSSKRARNST